MSMPTPPAPAAPHTEAEQQTDIIDVAKLRDHVTFALHSLRRHGALAFFSFMLVVSLSVASVFVLPRTYQVQTIIQALRNPSLPTLANAGLYRPYEADAPTRAARETVLRRDNLVSLIKQTDLVKKWTAERAPAIRLRDGVLRLFRRRDRTHDEQVDELVDRLEKNLAVDVSEGSVTITLNWPNAATAYELVETASQNFLETRHTTEIAIVSDAISILESHAQSLERQLEARLGQERLERTTRSAHARSAPVRRPAPRFTVAPEVVRLENKIAAKRRTISDLEEFRQRRLAELQAQLVQYQAMYADAHPAVVTLRQNIEALSAPSPQIEALRREVQDLDRELMAQGVETPVSISARPRLSGEDLGNAATAGAATVNPREEFEKYQTRMVFQNYANVLDRIDAARVEMDAAQAAFKYRYSVISPPQMPKRPLKPSPLNVFGAGLVGGLLLALFASVRADLRKGLIVESWQIERSLGIPILAESR